MANNSLNVSLPTSINGGGGGLNLNFDFGGNTQELATGAYTFLNNSFATDNGFLGGSISGTQAFLSNQTAPITAAVTKQVNTYSGIMPQLFGQLFGFANATADIENSIAGATIGTQGQLGQASIAVSRKAAGQGKLCFITTAVCDHYGLADDCMVLTLLRAFRDGYMRTDVYRLMLVGEYYRDAPAIVEAIAKRADKAQIYQNMRDYFLFPAVEAITLRQNDVALVIYKGLFDYAKAKAAE